MHYRQTHSLDFKELIKLFIRKSWLIILCTLVFSGIGFYQAMSLSTTYQSRVKVYIGSNSNVMTAYMDSNSRSYSAFIEAFKEIIVIEDFLNETLAKYDLDLTANQISGALSFTNSDTFSPILEIRYSNRDAELAQLVLNILVQELDQQAKKIMPDVSVQVVDSVKVTPIYPNKTKVVLTGATVGFVLSVGIILGLDFLDDTIRRKEQLERLVEVPLLGHLPHTKEKKGV